MCNKLKFIKTMNVVRVAVLVVAVILICLFFVGIGMQSDVTPGTIELGKQYTFVVLSGSMSPEINAGDIITVRKVDASEIEIGDAICFYSEDVNTYGWKITHKVNEKVFENGVYKYQTVSASGEIDKTWVTDSRIIGKVQNVLPKIGNAVLFMQGPTGYICFILVPLGALITLQLVFVVKKFRSFNTFNKNKQYELKQENEQLQLEMARLRKQIEKNESESGKVLDGHNVAETNTEEN